MKKGFSLVELSIVLIIIGLLIAGVSSGSKLIKQARINSLINELNELKNSFNIFEQIYDQLPGDINNAYDFFGSVDSCTNTSGGYNSCNGDGDYEIEWSYESYRSNQHLALAGLISGSYDGQTETISSSAFSSTIYHPALQCSSMGHSDLGTVCIQLGGDNIGNNAGLIPVDQYRVDYKLDDGLPLSGNIRFRAIQDVSTTTCGDSSGYILTSTSVGCNLLMTVDR
ncbi:MAG: prepilin-type N-terminal cleavage/methylation domain-containing protein [Alphaproteobacteria bacterium]|jgi:prepilin-type N-terminal cleavage/methylation domain-containing protein|nr:prepilin-type N-terminal cleavage/methylation domain-containing protein [Alphaproteobacteria bacterium]MBT5827876.1 prepilin-type N-terminal cleavage/methylation domain-containing protein [Alphaproteobacteria bacterium]